ncbi:MAG: FAD-dependent oxidoreductase [Gammaproteobacteria bacterium]|nr:FAD-dependent oxidoreductase [Gammaproteobacteria bacterium]
MTKKNFDIIIVGGGPAGIISGVTARKYYPDKSILLIKNVAQGVVPCGIPYMFSTLNKPEDNAMGDAPLQKNKIDFLVDEVVDLKKDEHKIETKLGNSFSYQKLVLANGSNPIIPPIKGLDKNGVYAIHKDMPYLKELKNKIGSAKNIVIIGGGFIGIEFADELSNINNLNVHLVEVLPRLLMNSFDPEFSKMVETKLEEKGVKLILGKKVVEIIGKEKVKKVNLDDNNNIKADLIILCIGAAPNIKLAEKAGLETIKSGICVDEYMRTSDKNIFAVGDCAGKKDFFTRKILPVMLASTATAEARVAGANLFQLKVVRENKGTIAIYSTYVDGLVLGSAGLSETAATNEGFEIVKGTAEVPSKHPTSLPNTEMIKVKLIFSKQSEVLMGGQISGGITAGEIINSIGLAIQQRVSLTELETLQMATHPHLTAPPTQYPLVLAAQNTLNR